MEIRHLWQLRLGLGAVALIAAAVLVIRRSPPEPLYQGVALSEWLDGTMHKKVSPRKIFEVMESVGPEASPWLLQLVERRERFLERRYLWFYGLARSAGRWLLNRDYLASVGPSTMRPDCFHDSRLEQS